MTFRLGVALAVLLVLVGGILLLRPGPLPAPREADVVSTLVAQFIAPLGDVPVASAASDCRTEGETRASLPAELFEAFLAANANAEAKSLHDSYRSSGFFDRDRSTTRASSGRIPGSNF